MSADLPQWVSVGLMAIAGTFVLLSTTRWLRPGSSPIAADAGVKTALLTEAPEPLPFIVIGDWGTGNTAQDEVARSLEVVATEVKPKFVLSTGDQIYGYGVKNVDDSQFSTKFDQRYMTLGNHDCLGNISAQVEFSKRSSRWRMPAQYYATEVQIPSATGADESILGMRIITVDACTLVCGVREPNYRCDPEILESVDQNQRKKQLEWLDAELTKPARWKIVVGHWPIFSFMGNGPSAELAETLLPRLLRHGVDIYFCGHDHSLQHIRHNAAGPRPGKVNPLHFFVSGGGGYRLHPELKPEADVSINKDATAVFNASVHGFMVVRVIWQSLQIEIIRSDDRQMIHSFSLKK